ncbi:hypothetical protein ZIOFF_001644 [Zingiber officinale]|uniref:Glycosyltransferase 61 catalytic domain-containing protein n=2 Tax=Zingiber officinale TaxID=94328 RepID=A0A8J5I3X3_ZINOF|nr:hypothetical protein ZIOFF_001644 [Zingiber officinale]
MESFNLFSLHSLPLLQRSTQPCCLAPEEELNLTLPILRQLDTFFPLKDLNFSDQPTSARTWFMSSFNDSFDDDGDSQYLYFPSMTSNGRLLCLSARDVSDGTRNSYALAWPEALPDAAALFPGLTFVSDTFYDYDNLWHGLSALLPFASWHQRKQCVVPARWVLFHQGELRTTMGKWVRTLAEAAVGEVRIEDFGSGGGTGGMACFEKALVFRHNEGAMKKQRRRAVYAGMRCRARAHCGVVGDRREEDSTVTIRLTLLLRLGSRAFKNESAVMGIFERECAKVEGCRVQVAWGNNMTFCDQVKLMRETDVLVSPHGAQLANLFLMEEKSSIMEFYPKGWNKLAGEGQYVYRWMADWAGMQHKGSWQDPEEVECADADQLKCFSLYKDGKIGVDEKYFAQWGATVLEEAKELKLTNGRLHIPSTPCPCM